MWNDYYGLLGIQLACLKNQQWEEAISPNEPSVIEVGRIASEPCRALGFEVGPQAFPAVGSGLKQKFARSGN